MGDEFAKKYLGAEQAIHSERVTHRAVFALLIMGIVFGVASIGVGVAAALTNPALFAAAGGLLITALAGVFFGLFFSTSRIVIGKDELVLHFGRERRIPLSAITEATVVTMGLDSKSKMRRERASDFGARAGRSHAVRIAYAEGGETKIVYVPANDPAKLASLLGAKAETKTRVGSETSSASQEEDDDTERAEPGRLRT